MFTCSPACFTFLYAFSISQEGLDAQQGCWEMLCLFVKDKIHTTEQQEGYIHANQKGWEHGAAHKYHGCFNNVIKATLPHPPKTTHNTTALHSGCNPLILKISHLDPHCSTYSYTNTPRGAYYNQSNPDRWAYTKCCRDRDSLNLLLSLDSK